MSKRKTEILHDSSPSQALAQTEALAAYVLRTLGRPANLIAVQVRPLWEHHYRVNILVGESVAAVTIAHSYFLVLGSDGSCLSAHPALTREYASSAGAAPQA